MKRNMNVPRMAAMLTLLASTASMALSAPLILNEYNAVKDGGFLKDSGSDSYFGTVSGNGGDWMEFVVTEDKADIRGWSFVTYQAGAYDGTITLPALSELAAVRSGTIFTIAELVPTDLSCNPQYDPADPDTYFEPV